MTGKLFILAAALLTLGTVSLAQMTGTGNGVEVCNCTSGKPLTGANLPHAKVVKVTIEGSNGESVDAGSQETGLTGNGFSRKTVPVGKCMSVKYTFDCAQVDSDHDKWVCWVVSFTEDTRDC